jgi:GNAT superfamily N-acetyltransferase
MVDFWPREQVSSDLHHEIILESSAWLAVDGEKVVGFCWGYPITFDELEAKLELPVGHVSKGSERVAYQDDVGILAPYRRQGFARKMITLRHDDFIAQGLSIGITRTRELPEPSVTHTWYTRDLGYKIVARYPGDDGRVVLARPLDGLRELLN